MRAIYFPDYLWEQVAFKSTALQFFLTHNRPTTKGRDAEGQSKWLLVTERSFSFTFSKLFFQMPNDLYWSIGADKDANSLNSTTWFMSSLYATQFETLGYQCVAVGCISAKILPQPFALF
jgi:hypothetical protein